MFSVLFSIGLVQMMTLSLNSPFHSLLTKQSATICWRVAYQKNSCHESLPDYRKWHFLGLA